MSKQKTGHARKLTGKWGEYLKEKEKIRNILISSRSENEWIGGVFEELGSKQTEIPASVMRTMYTWRNEIRDQYSKKLSVEMKTTQTTTLADPKIGNNVVDEQSIAEADYLNFHAQRQKIDHEMLKIEVKFGWQRR